MKNSQYLEKAYRLNELIDSNLRELDYLKELSTFVSSPSSTMERVKTSNISDTVANTVVKIVTMEREINKDIDNLIDIKSKVHKIINSIEDHNERLLLRLRYVEFLKWDVISEKMCYSSRQVQRIHNKTILKLDAS